MGQLRLCQDLTAAGWIADSDLPWWRLVTFGPAGFAAYARLRLLPDPAWPGQSENDVVDSEDWRDEQLTRLHEILAGHTADADDCYVCVWDGWGQSLPAPRVQVPHRAYWLFRGPLSEVATGPGAGWPQEQAAFLWPADRGWCVTHDVDPHWVGIGGPARLIEQLVADPALDVVPADPAQEQPFYR